MKIFLPVPVPVAHPSRFTRFFLTLIFALLAPGIFAQSSCPLTAYGDTTLCVPSSVQLGATTGFDTYTWSPSTGLSDPNIPDPMATVAGSATYILTATGTSELITNGDFSLGNYGFTSEQTYSSTYSPCNYYVNSMFFAIPAYTFPDHTPTADNMFMSIDGCYLGVTVIYETTVPVSMLTNYNFSFWASRADYIQPHFEIHFAGNITGDVLMASLPGIPYAGVWTWDEYSAPLWNSGPNSTVTIKIVNIETDGAGNDFAMDDVSFHTTCTATDTVEIDFGLTTTVTGITSVCPGESTTLTATGGSSFLWNTGDTTAVLNITPAASGVYTVIGNGGAGCVDTVAVPVTVLPQPTALITGPDSLCQGKTGVLTASGGTGYLWNTLSTASSINVTPVLTTTYTMMAYDANGCSDTATHTVYVSPYPLPPYMRDTNVCVGVSLPALQAIGQNITWYGSAGSTVGTTLAPFPYTDAVGLYEYFATQTVNHCESDKAVATVLVMDKPSVALPDSLFVCEGDTVRIGPVMNNVWTYSWMDAVNVSPRPVNQSGLYVLNATNNCGTDSDSCAVTVDLCDCYFYLPNAVTPNGDGLNEVFKPLYDCDFDTYHLRIFDRWGEVIFDTQNPDEAWDIRYKNRVVQEDVYVVLVQYTAWAGPKLITKEYRGHLTVVR